MQLHCESLSRFSPIRPPTKRRVKHDLFKPFLCGLSIFFCWNLEPLARIVILGASQDVIVLISCHINLELNSVKLKAITVAAYIYICIQYNHIQVSGLSFGSPSRIHFILSVRAKTDNNAAKLHPYADGDSNQNSAQGDRLNQVRVLIRAFWC